MFSFATTVTTTAAGLGILSVASLICDLLLQFIFSKTEWGKFYFDAKTYTIDVNDSESISRRSSISRTPFLSKQATEQPTHLDDL